jgi:hypothetical protein
MREDKTREMRRVPEEDFDDEISLVSTGGVSLAASK